eukprot:c31158_g1_i1.p1 GENE.c31158_g1_i1~~c31158_g1_i1.p1  ORF type:complete len:149 (-),score=68.80 c31158_g1_i1:37-483(-)
MPLTSEQEKEFKEIFDLFDKSQEGKIETKQFHPLLKKLGLDLTQLELDILSQEVVDFRRATHLSFTEFLQIMENYMNTTSSAKHLQSCIRTFDPENHGNISKADLVKLQQTFTHQYTDFQIEEMIRYADFHGKGYVDHNEFLRALTKQ